MMRRQLVITGDGSHTIHIPELNTTYHSLHGAIQESMHVFINAGLKFRLEKPITSNSLNIFEFGFGTGLNAILSLIEGERTGEIINYTTIELFPLSGAEAGSLNYCSELKRSDLQIPFDKMHTCDWEQQEMITQSFYLLKTKQAIAALNTVHKFDIVYFDAFDPGTQPELWTSDIFSKLYGMMNNDGVLATYSSKGDVRRAMLAAGFTVKKIPGPIGKREITRAVKVA